MYDKYMYDLHFTAVQGEAEKGKCDRDAGQRETYAHF